MSDSFILIDRVSFSYGSRRILRDLQLSLQKGTSYALIGKSGTGKSTLLNLIAGFLSPECGQLLIDGAAIHSPRSKTAFLFQELGLFPWQTVKEAVSMPLKLRGKKDGVEEAVLELLHEMKLELHKDKYPAELSGGERQRVALARTLIGEPDLLLMDEPTSSLDAMTKEELQRLIFREQRKRKATYVFVTHDIEEAILLGQKILLLNDDGTITELPNAFYAVPEAREQIGFYDECIKIRKLLKPEKRV